MVRWDQGEESQFREFEGGENSSTSFYQLSESFTKSGTKKFLEVVQEVVQ